MRVLTHATDSAGRIIRKGDTVVMLSDDSLGIIDTLYRSEGGNTLAQVQHADGTHTCDLTRLTRLLS
jgi:hypothetical protein